MARFTRRLTSLRFEDANGLGMTMGPGEGNLSIGEQLPENAEHLEVFDSGIHDGFVLGDDTPQDVSFTLFQEAETLTSGAAARVRDFMMRTGTFSEANGSVSVDDTVWAYKAIATFTNGTSTGTMTMPKVRGAHTMQVAKEGNTFGFSGSNHGLISVT